MDEASKKIIQTQIDEVKQIVNQKEKEINQLKIRLQTVEIEYLRLQGGITQLEKLIV